MSELTSKIYSKPGNHISFEIFPPKTPRGLKQIYQTIARLKSLNPDFISVTYGAGGSTAEKSLEIASAVQNLAEINCVAHFTCVGMNIDQVDELLGKFKFHGINNVLALRGDPPAGEKTYQKPENGFGYASELVKFIRNKSDVGIMVAGYPEGHNENPSQEDDFKHLIEKINAGADGIVTQLFFDNQKMISFKKNLGKAGIKIPISAGIFPISNAKQIVRITELSGASIPPDLQKALDKFKDSPEEMEVFGTDYAVRQVEELIENGIHHFHFYTMNRDIQTRKILYRLKKYFPQLEKMENPE